MPLPLTAPTLVVTTTRGAIGLGSPTFDKAIDGGVSTSDVLRVVPCILDRLLGGPFGPPQTGRWYADLAVAKHCGRC